MKITRRSTQILIEDYVYNDKLEKDLSVYDFLKKDFVFSSFFKRDENTILIPASFPIEEYCEEEIIEDFKCIRPKKIDFELYQPIRPESVSLEAFNARNAEQDVIYNKLINDKTPQKFLSGRTGIGKSYIILRYLKKEKNLPILFVENNKIKDNWLDEIRKFTDILDEEILILSGRESVDKVLNTKKTELPKYKFVIAIHRTFKLLIDDSPDLVQKVLLHLSIGTKLFDEAHNEWTNMVNIDLLSNVKDTIYITSTPYKNDSAENKVYLKCYGNIEKVGLDNKYENKYHNVKVIRFNTSASKKDIKGMATFQYSFVAQRYTQYLMTEEAYKIFIAVLLKILKGNIKTKRKIAFIFNNNALIDMVYKDITSVLNKYNIESTVGIFNQNSNQKDTDIILTTDKSLNKAINIPGLKSLVNTVPLTGNGSIEQIIGRLRFIPDEEVNYYDLVDYSIPDCVKQLKKRASFYATICKSYTVIDFN